MILNILSLDSENVIFFGNLRGRIIKLNKYRIIIKFLLSIWTTKKIFYVFETILIMAYFPKKVDGIDVDQLQQQKINCNMSIPIIVSRKKSNGQIQHIRLTNQKQLPFQRTFNPNAFNLLCKQPSQHNYQLAHQQIVNELQHFQQRKLSRGRPRRISSSGVSKRFPKDFFKNQQHIQHKKNNKTFETLAPIKAQRNSVKRPQSMMSIVGNRQIIQNMQTPKFNKIKKSILYPNSLNIKAQLQQFCFSHIKQKDQNNNQNKIKIKPFKIKNSISKAFICHIKHSTDQNNNKKHKINKDKENKDLGLKEQYNNQPQKKIVNIGGKRVRFQQNNKGNARIKLLGIY